MNCNACYANRKGRWWYLGLSMCWVCRWIRTPAPLGLMPLINKLDPSGTRPKIDKE